MPTDADPTSTRLQQLEQKLNRIMMAVILLLLVVSGVVLLRYFPESQVRTHRLVVVDESGSDRILLSTQGRDALIYLFGEDGRPQLAFTTTPHGGLMQLQDHEGHDRVAINGGAHPSIVFFDKESPYVPWLADTIDASGENRKQE